MVAKRLGRTTRSKPRAPARRTRVPAIDQPEVAAAFERVPPRIRRELLALRRLIFETAAATPGVGAIEETLKWGEPAYLTPETKSGSTIRLGWKKSAPQEYAVCFHCQTTLVRDFRERFPDHFRFDENRRIVFRAGEPVAKDPLAHCIAEALTYHLGKKSRR